MSKNSSKRGFFRNAFDAVVEARHRQANHYVARMSRLYGYDFSNSDKTRDSN